MRATVWTSKYEQPGVFNVAETDVVSTHRLDASNLSPRDPEEELDGERGRAVSSRGIRTYSQSIPYQSTVPRPAASTPLGNLLEKQILGLHPDLLNLKPGVKWQQSVSEQAYQEILMHSTVGEPPS